VKLKTAAVIVIVLVVVILAAALFYSYSNQAGYTTDASVERDQSHNGDGWIIWTPDGSQHGSQDGSDYSQDGSDHVDTGPTTSFEDFYDSGKSGADASELLLRTLGSVATAAQFLRRPLFAQLVRHYLMAVMTAR
jgi:hypothetical protein